MRRQLTADTRATRPAYGLLLLIGGLIGLVSACALILERIEKLKNPDYIPTCNVNPVLSCGSVMSTPQAEAFGVPNPMLGIAGFAVVACIGAVLLAKATLPAWFWIATQLGLTFAVVFVHWLISQSLYVIGALCPYCMAVWAVTIPMFWFTTVVNLRALAGRVGPGAGRVIGIIVEYRVAILTAWFLLILVLVAQRFWDFWSSLI